MCVLRRWALAAAVVFGIGVVPTEADGPVGSGFTFQGTLTDGNQPADGFYDFEFKLMTAGTGGAQSGLTLVAQDVDVVGGTFTVKLDFGTYVNSAEARWLAVGVRAGTSSGAFTALSPRQELTPAPFALNLALPYSAFATTPTPLFFLTQNGAGAGLHVLSNGTGTGIQSNVQNAASGNVALAGTTNGTGRAVFGHNTGTGTAGFFDTTNLLNSNPALVGQSAGVGAGVKGINSSAHGSAGLFEIDNVASPKAAVQGKTNGTGAAIHGHCPTNQGVAGHFQIDGVNSGFDVVLAETEGAGTAVHADSAKGMAGHFENNNGSNNQPTLRSETSSLQGRAGMFLVDNLFGQGDALFAQNGGVGTAIKGVQVRNGIAGHFETNGSGNGTAVYAKTIGSGKTLFVESNHANASAIYARATSGGTALELDQGAIKITGAGLNTPTPVFVHQVTDANLGLCWPGTSLCYGTMIDHPMCNNKPGAMLIVTEIAEHTSVRLAGLGVEYLASQGKWYVTALGDDGDGDFDLGQKFNVLVFNP